MSGRQGQLPFAPMPGTVPHVYGKLGGGIWFLAAMQEGKRCLIRGPVGPPRAPFWAPTPACEGKASWTQAALPESVRPQPGPGRGTVPASPA